jgi:hypothetical protein
MILTSVVILAIAVLVYSGYLFIDFQFQVGSFIWGKRLGIKRRSGSVPSTPHISSDAQ